MDFHLKQCRNQEESEQQHSAKISKFFVEEPHHHHHQQPESSVSSVLPLFVPDSNNSKTSTILSAFPDSTSSTNRLPRMLGYFSVAQRQELELQALIFRYMLAGAAVPAELLHPIKKSLLSSTTPFFLHHPLQHFPHYPTSLLQAGYWGRAAMDPEPGRCRRTDGKKWRCSRDVVAGQKYCERHMHRGRNRSRKPVETATTNTTATTSAAGANGGGVCSLSSNTNRVVGGGGRPFLTVESGNYFSLSGQTPSVDLLHLNQRPCSDSLLENKNFYESQKEGSAGDGKSDGHILRHFFDDWPRSNHGGNDNNVTQQMNSTSASATSLSISIPGNLSSSSDVSLKLSTGGSDQGNGHHIHQDGNSDREHVQLNWAAGWAATQMASMGGPLAEALRSANNNSSPTSVLHQLQRATNSEASFIST